MLGAGKMLSPKQLINGNIIIPHPPEISIISAESEYSVSEDNVFGKRHKISQ